MGTQTLRLARNVNDFLMEAQNTLGYPIEVISGREEARLVFEGCMHTLPPSNLRRLVVDIGGASTEIIVGRGFTADKAESFKVGCVNTSLRFFKDGRIDRASLKKAQVAAAAEFEEAIAGFSRAQWEEAFGSTRHRGRGIGNPARARLVRRHDQRRRPAEAAPCLCSTLARSAASSWPA